MTKNYSCGSIPVQMSRRFLLTGATASVATLTLGLHVPDVHAQTVPPKLTAKLSTVATFPKPYFLENLTVRKDNSLLVTVLNKKELWYVPPAGPQQQVAPVLLHTFSQPTTGILEAEPDVFYICTSNVFTTHESYLHRLDLRDWRLGTPVPLSEVLKFPASAGALNGCCLLTPTVILVADSIAGLFWQVDLASKTGRAEARVWLKHDSMALVPDNPVPNQPGINSVHYAAQTSHLYYTSTAQMLFMRVRVDTKTFEPAGTPELVARGRMWDDFCIDEDAGVAYITTHRQNTIDRVSLDPEKNNGPRYSVVGEPFSDELIGPSSVAWGRGPHEFGRVAYAITDGGLTAPRDGLVREARVLRIEFSSL
ncbi:hypothetical protein D3C71_1036680 [compost metagenome]